MGLVFKCASDTIFLDDFKKVLNSLVAAAMGRAGGAVHSGPMNSRRRSSAARPNHSGHDRFGSAVDHQVSSTNTTSVPRRNSSDCTTVKPPSEQSYTPPPAHHHSRWGTKLFHRLPDDPVALEPQIQRSTSIHMSSAKPEEMSDQSYPGEPMSPSRSLQTFHHFQLR